jgi:hypothetical protein
MEQLSSLDWAEEVAVHVESLRKPSDAFELEVCNLDDAVVAFNHDRAAKVVLEDGRFVVTAEFESPSDAAAALIAVMRAIGG